MEEKKYYLAERIKKRFFIDSFNTDVLMQRGNKLEMLSSKVIKPEEHSIKLEKNQVICTDDTYKIEETTKEKAIETLKEMGLNYSLWQHYMSNSDSHASSQLNGLGGEKLM